MVSFTVCILGKLNFSVLICKSAIVVFFSLVYKYRVVRIKSEINLYKNVRLNDADRFLLQFFNCFVDAAMDLRIVRLDTQSD